MQYAYASPSPEPTYEHFGKALCTVKNSRPEVTSRAPGGHRRMRRTLRFVALSRQVLTLPVLSEPSGAAGSLSV